MAIKVVDISKHNGNVSWQSLKEVGVQGVIIRAGYGLIVDPMWMSNYNGAIKNGFKVGVYWFAYPLNTDGAKKEADKLYSLIAGKKLELGVWYDYEYDTTAYLKKNKITENKTFATSLIKAFCEQMRTHGIKCGLYLNRDYIQNHLNYDELRQYPLWQAAWTTSGYSSFSAVNENRKPTAYGNIMMWQFSKGLIGGKAFDLNYYYGTVNIVKESDPDYAALVCQKAGLEQQTKDYLNNYKWAKYLWEKLWKAML